MSDRVRQVAENVRRVRGQIAEAAQANGRHASDITMLAVTKYVAQDGVQALIDAGSTWPLVRIPSPVVDPTDPNISGPFMIRVISHCTDQQGHGLSPAVREAWFQYP